MSTVLENVIDWLPPEYKTKKDKWLKAVKDGSMKRMELLIALAKEHKALFPEYQKKSHETALVMGGSPKMKCFGCSQWGHKSKDCPKKKKSDGKSKDRSKGDWKGSSKKGGKESHVRCHHCKKLGHMRPHCPRLQDKEKNEDGAYTHVDVVLAMDDGLEIGMDRENTSYGVCEVQEAMVACSPYEDPVKDVMRYPFMSPKRHEDPEDKDSLEDAKTVVARTSNAMIGVAFVAGSALKKGHVRISWHLQVDPFEREGDVHDWYPLPRMEIILWSLMTMEGYSNCWS